MTNVLLVDDHRLVRSGLAALLATTTDITVVGEAADGAQAVDLAAQLKPDVILMDLSMPVLDGVSATKLIVAADPASRVVILTSFADHHRVTDAIAAGAVGYLLKDSEPQDVLAALRSAASGGVPLDPRVARALLPSADQRPGDGLSSREQQVLRLLQRGLANKQIGRALGISERTVKVHVGSIFRRLGVADRTSAAMWARDNLPRRDLTPGLRALGSACVRPDELGGGRIETAVHGVRAGEERCDRLHIEATNGSTVVESVVVTARIAQVHLRFTLVRGHPQHDQFVAVGGVCRAVARLVRAAAPRRCGNSRDGLRCLGSLES